MDDLFANEPQKRGINPVFIVGVLVAVAVLGAGIWFFARKPAMDDQKAQILAAASKEGSPEFADLSKDIIISTDPSTMWSPTGLGTISMYITGNIRNKGTRTITALEVNVAVVTQFNDVLKERRVLVVPVQRQTLGAGETIPVTLDIPGFNKDDDRANIRWKVTAISAQ